jgi:hypothetical protein
VHQPEVPDLIGPFWLLACQPRPSESPPAEPAGPVLWRLSGRVTVPATASSAPPFDAAHLLERCGDARPCAAELWRTEAGSSAVMLLAGEHLQWEGSQQRWPATWRRLGTELSWCLEGGALATPPAGDPGGFRLLSATDPPAEDPQARWVLHLGGANTCDLSGELLLSAQRDRVDSRGLTSGGQPWSEGGRVNALEILKANAAAK